MEDGHKDSGMGAWDRGVQAVQGFGMVCITRNGLLESLGVSGWGLLGGGVKAGG